MVGAWQHPRLAVRLAGSAGLLVLSVLGALLLVVMAVVLLPLVVLGGLVVWVVRGVGGLARGAIGADASGRRNVRVIRRDDGGGAG